MREVINQASAWTAMIKIPRIAIRTWSDIVKKESPPKKNVAYSCNSGVENRNAMMMFAIQNKVIKIMGIALTQPDLAK